MKKLLLIVAVMSMTACSSLKSMNEEHKAERKELRGVHKSKVEKMRERNKIEMKLLTTKQAIEFVGVGTQKYKEMKAEIDKMEEALKNLESIIKG